MSPSETAGPSRGSSTIQPMDVDDSLVNLRPPGSRRLSGTRNPRPSQSIGTGGAGLRSWGLVGWPVTTVFSIISGAWYFFSTSHRNLILVCAS